MSLSEQDQQRIRAAEGWLALGDWLSANDELEQMDAVNRALPSVIGLRVRIYCAADKMDVAAILGGPLARRGYQDAETLLALAVALTVLGKPAEARVWLAAAVNLDQTPQFKTRIIEDPRLASALVA